MLEKLRIKGYTNLKTLTYLKYITYKFNPFPFSSPFPQDFFKYITKILIFTKVRNISLKNFNFILYNFTEIIVIFTLLSF